MVAVTTHSRPITPHSRPIHSRFALADFTLANSQAVLKSGGVPLGLSALDSTFGNSLYNSYDRETTSVASVRGAPRGLQLVAL